MNHTTVEIAKRAAAHHQVTVSHLLQNHNQVATSVLLLGAVLKSKECHLLRQTNEQIVKPKRTPRCTWKMVYGENALLKRSKSWRNELRESLQGNLTLVMVMMAPLIRQIQVKKGRSKLEELNVKRRNGLNKNTKGPSRWSVRRELNRWSRYLIKKTITWRMPICLNRSWEI